VRAQHGVEDPEQVQIDLGNIHIDDS
jgi:hypothetical protein